MDSTHPKLLSGEWYIGKTCPKGHSLRRSSDDRCIACRNALTSQWKKDNPNRVKETNSRSTKKHRKTVTEKQRQRRQRDGYKPRTEEGRKYQREWQKQKRLKDPTGTRKIKVIAEGKRRSRLKGATLEPIDKTDIEALLAQFDHTCAYCGSPGKLTLDHIYPLNGGGAHALSNLVPACKPCNSSKNDSHPLDWYEKQVFYSRDRLKFIAQTKELTRWLRIYGIDGDGSTP